MKTIYIECNMGAAGDMLMAALLELLPDPDVFLEKLNALGIPGVCIKRKNTVKCGIAGTQVAVQVAGETEESVDVPAKDLGESGNGVGFVLDEGQAGDTPTTSAASVQGMVRSLHVSDKVKGDALAVYGLIAEAEMAVHGKPLEDIHYHEVGRMDAVADIVGVCLLMEQLAPRRVVASPVHVGSGFVKCAHGVLPVPAPATAHILKGVPTYGGALSGELCTPTGAALLRFFAHEFGNRPEMVVDAIGYGMGKKDFPAANCMRVFMGESNTSQNSIVEIACNLDDMTGEEMGFALERLLEEGALDVYMVPIQMKKSRPGQMLVCLCKPEDKEKITSLMMKYTTTFGVRTHHWERHTLERSFAEGSTSYGTVSIKTGSGGGVVKSKVEYEDLARLARENHLTLWDVKKEI